MESEKDILDIYVDGSMVPWGKASKKSKSVRRRKRDRGNRSIKDYTLNELKDWTLAEIFCKVKKDIKEKIESMRTDDTTGSCNDEEKSSCSIGSSIGFLCWTLGALALCAAAAISLWTYYESLVGFYVFGTIGAIVSLAFVIQLSYMFRGHHAPCCKTGIFGIIIFAVGATLLGLSISNVGDQNVDSAKIIMSIAIPLFAVCSFPCLCCMGDTSGNKANLAKLSSIFDDKDC